MNELTEGARNVAHLLGHVDAYSVGVGFCLGLAYSALMAMMARRERGVR